MMIHYIPYFTCGCDVVCNVTLWFPLVVWCPFVCVILQGCHALATPPPQGCLCHGAHVLRVCIAVEDCRMQLPLSHSFGCDHKSLGTVEDKKKFFS